MSFIVRVATPDDLSTITAIYNDAVRNTTAIWNEVEVDIANRRQWFDERTGRGFPVLVAVDGSDVPGSDVLGYATFGDFRPFAGYRHTVENSVYVRHDKRGQGIAAALMPALIDAARQSGKHMMIAAIEATNEASVKLHTRFGFAPVGHLPQVGQKFGRWLDLTLMQLKLED
ncbi:MAG: GNAT family N-acetyltransferase [Parvibaculaceae bacterium]